MLKTLLTKTELARAIGKDSRHVSKMIAGSKIKPVYQNGKGKPLFREPKQSK